MNKKFIIRKNEEIQEIVKTSKKIVSKYFIIYYRNNDYSYNRFCVSVSKKIGKAHTRNLFKRRIKDILMKNKLNNSNDYVIILRNAVTDILYDKMKLELLDILKGVK
jgi:ribonuclease P protein component